MGTFKYTIPMKSPDLIGRAFDEAIAAHVTAVDDIWDAEIRLVKIKFESNFRRTEYEAEFEVTDTDNESPSQ